MDKSKSKGDLRAAGKKRLEEFRQKKQQKGSSNKSSSTATMALVDDDMSPSEGSPVTQQDNALDERSDGQGANLTGKSELGVEPPQQVQSSTDDGPVSGDSKLETQLLCGRKPFEPEPLRESEATTSLEPSSSSELVTKSVFSEQSNGGEYESKGGERSEYPTDSKISPPVGSGQVPQDELFSNGITGDSRLDNASSNNSDTQSEHTLREDGGEVPTTMGTIPILQESMEQQFITEIEALKGQLQSLVEQKKLVSNQLAVKAEEQLEDASRVKSLIADVESIQQELSFAKKEKVQLVEEFTLSQKELQNTNQHLASELVTSQEELAAASHRASLLSGDLERVKQETTEASTKFTVEMERMQNFVKDGEVRIAQLVEELATTKTLFEGLQNEKVPLHDELGRFENELHTYGEELRQKGDELEASKQRIQALEEDLASEQRTAQQVQELVAEKSQLVEAGRVSNEKLEALLSAKEVELGSNRNQIRDLQSEKWGLVIQLEEFKRHLDHARQKEEGVRADLVAQNKAYEEQLKQLQDEKAELSDDLEKSKLLSKRLSDQKSSLLTAFDADLEQLREALRKREEGNTKQGNQLLESRQELQKLGDDHAQVLKELEIALDECRTALDHERVEKSKSVQGLMSEKDQLLSSIEGKEQEVVTLGYQLQELEDQLRTKAEENTSLVTVLEESKDKLQKTAKSASEFEAELEKHRAVSDGLLEEKGSLAAEVLDIRAQYVLMQQTANEHVLELERVREDLRGLEEDHRKLSSQSILSTDELTTVRAELVAYREQVTKLEEQNSNLVKALEDTQNELQRASELELELEKVRENLRGLEEEHSKLSSQTITTIDELAKIRAEKKAVELELVASREQSTKLEEQNSNLVKVLEDTQNELQRVRDDHLRSSSGLALELDKHKELSSELLIEKERLAQTANEHVLELERVRDNLRGLQEDHSKLSSQSIMGTDELTKVRAELVAYREQATKLEEQSSNLVKVLEGTQNELQRVREDHLLSSSDRASELDKQRVLFSELLVEKEILASELQSATEKYESLQQERTQSRKEFISEFEELQKRLKELEQNHSKATNDLTVSQSEQMSKLKEEKSLAEVELSRCREELTNLEDVKKVLVEGWDRHNEQLNASLIEHEKLLFDQFKELEKLREQQRDAEDTKTLQEFNLQQLLSDLQELKDEKIKIVLELETYKEQYQELGDQNWRVSSELNKYKDQVQLLIEEKISAESMLEESREMERKLKEGNGLLVTELEEHRERQQNILEQKVNAIEELQEQVTKFVQSQERMTRELAEAREQSKLLAVARLELLSNLEGLSQQLNNVSQETDVLRSDLEVSKQQLEELVEEKGNLISKLEVALETWKVEKLQLSRDLEVSMESHTLLSADKAQVDSGVAQLTLKTHELDAQRAQLALEVEVLKELIHSSDEQRARLVSEVESKDRLLQTLAEEKSQADSHLQMEREKVNICNDQLVQLTEDLGIAKLRIEELELETAQLKVDLKSSQTQVEVLTKEKSKLTEDLTNHLSKGEQSHLESEQKSLQFGEEIQEMRQIIESKEGELDQLKTRCKLSEAKLEVSNVERCDLAQDLASLKRQLQQLSELKAHGGHEVAQSVEASTQRGLGIEESKHESSLKAEKVAQGLHALVADTKQEQDTGEDTQDPVQDVQRLHRLEELSENLGQELREALSLVAPFRLEFENHTLQLKKALEENLHLADLGEQLESKQHELDTAFVRMAELDSQVKELAETAANLQAEKDIALEALVDAQEELRQSTNKLVEENARLEGRLRVLEATAATLQIERCDLAGKLVGLEQSHASISERALQDSVDKVSLQDHVAALEAQIGEYNTELGNHRDMVSRSNLLVQSLVQKVEGVICDAFPKAGELLSNQDDQLAADYHNVLASRLHTETAEVCHQLQTAHVQLVAMNKQLQESEDQLMILQTENRMAIETAEQVQSQMIQVSEEKKELETSLKRLEAIASAASVRADEQAMNFANLQAERDDLTGKLASLEQSHTHISERALQDSNDKVGLQDQVAALEAQVADYNTDLGDHKEMVSNRLVQSLVQKLEDLISDAFPKAGLESVSPEYDKLTADYHNSLTSKLRFEITEVCHQLQHTHAQLSELNKQLQEAEEQLMTLQKEKTVAVETAEQIWSKLMKAAEEKEELETSMKRLEAENVKVDERTMTSANQASEVEGQLLQIQTLTKRLENANVEKEELQTELAQAAQKLSVTRDKLSLAITKGKAAVQQRDAWKASLAEKSRELEMLVVSRQQELQDKDAALDNAERKIVDLTASVEQNTSFQKMVSTAEQAFLENEDLVHSLCAMLDNTVLPDDWRSSELTNKILWITGPVSRLLRELEGRKEDMLTLVEHVAALTSTVKKSEASLTALAAELSTLEHEKEALVSRLEDGNHQLELERGQMTEEKAQLTSIIRQQDSDIEMQKREKENFETKLREQAEEIVRLEAEIASLVTKVTEQEWDLNTRALSYNKLDATVNTLLRNLSDCYGTISPVDSGAVSAHSPLDRCKYVVKLLVGNHNLTVVKLEGVLSEGSLLSDTSEGGAKVRPLYRLDDYKTSSKEISSGVIEIIEEALASLEQQAVILVEEQSEKNRLQMELTQKHERLNTVRERLSVAVSKGKSAVQQRDSLKQVVMEKNAEVEALASAHKEELQSKEILLQEASNKLTSSLEHAAELEKDIVFFKNSVASIPDPSVAERLSEMDEQLSEAQHRANAAESEAAILLSKLEVSQTKLGSLVEEVNSLTKDKNENFQQFSEMGRQLSEAQHRANAAESEAAVHLSKLEVSQTRLDSLVEEVNSLTKETKELVQQLQELAPERTRLMSEIHDLKHSIVMAQEEREILIQDYNEVSDKCGEWRSQTQEGLAAKGLLLAENETLQLRIAELMTALDSEAQARMKLESDTQEVLAARDILRADNETLQQRIAELKMGLDSEVQARMEWESDTKAVVARIQNSTGEHVSERSFDSKSQPNSRLDSLSALLVVKYEAALQEIREISEQKALLAESQKTMMEKALLEPDNFDKLEELQQRLASTDSELSEARKRIEEAESRSAKEDAAASKAFLEEVRVLKEELAKARSETDALRSEFVQVEQKGATMREKLNLAIKKGKGVAQQRDLLKQSLSEQQSLVANYKDELQNKESALKQATREISVREEKIQALELNVSYKDNLMKKMDAVLTKWDSPSEWQSKDITEKLEWLVSAVSEAQNHLINADREIEALRKTSAQLRSDQRDAQTRANLEQEARSALAVKLEEILRELEQSQKRIAELETLLLELGGVGQQTELLTREVLDLQKSVQQKQAEVDRAEEAVNAWVKRSEESEKYIQLCQERISELEQTVQESIGAQQQVEHLQDEISHLEEAVQQREAAVKAMETSRGKAVNKLTLTTNKFRELYHQSEGLVVELESMHKSHQEKDAEIMQLKEELVNVSKQSQISQEMLDSQISFQLHLEKLLEAAVLSGGADSVTSPPMTEKEISDQPAVRKSVYERSVAHVNLLQKQLTGLTAQSQAWQVELERKNVSEQGLRKELEEVIGERAQLAANLKQLTGLTAQSQAWQVELERKNVSEQGLRKELEEVIGERAQLAANLQREQVQSERLKAEIATMRIPVTEREASQAEEIEEVHVGKRLLPISTPTTHARGARRPTPIDVAIDVDSEMKQLLESNPVEFDDKGHGFKSLASSRFMPRGTRAIGEQIDRLCVAGGRVLMRQPAARLFVTLYWLAIHIWMVFLISAAHI